MAVTFARHLGSPSDLTAGQFTVNTESGRAELCCPLCGAVFVLPSHCAVDATGRVNYSIKCGGSNPCAWWDWAVLADHWSEL